MSASALNIPAHPARTAPAGIHVAMIMDGNGRWATARALPRAAGHRRGAEVVRQIVEAAPTLGVGTLTLYAFSSDNWRRPPREVAALMRLFRAYLHGETARLAESGVRVSIIGRRDRLALALRAAIDAAEERTAALTRLHLRLAIDYSARDAIVRAAQHLAPGEAPTRERFEQLLATAYGSETGDPTPVRDVDLLIRTGGERRLSDFLLWECAYAELYFANCMWPDFTSAAFAAAIGDFHARDRRFGGLSSEPRRAANY